MARAARRGFTLVEMLVVITIIGMLVALLIPAALGVQNAARRAVCMNNMREVTVACLRYETKNNRFPPQFLYEVWPRDAGQQVEQKVGWVVTILAELGKGELAGLFNDGKLILPPRPWLAYGTITKEQVVSQARVTMGHSYISQLVCPANPPSSLTLSSLSYVCNAGINDVTQAGFAQSDRPDDYKENGVFMNRIINHGTVGDVAVPPNEIVSNAYINEHDGTSQTLLVSENVNAQIWAQDVSIGSTPPGLSAGFALSPTPFQQGMLWSAVSVNIPGLGNFRVADPNEEIYTSPPLQVGIQEPSLLVSRPSSLHGTGYHAAFCSGNVTWLSNQMDKSIYPLLMTPNGAHTKDIFGNEIPQQRAGLPTIINEEELAR